MLESELSESAPLTCNECYRLWQEYENAVRAHAEIVDDYQRALIQRDSCLYDPMYGEDIIMHPKRADPSEREKIEAPLMSVLLSTKAVYERDKRQLAEALENLERLGRNHPEGRESVRRAASAQMIALLNYARALTDFNRFILDGKLLEDSG